MGRSITWCKYCQQVISFENHEAHYHEHDLEHNHQHTADQENTNDHDHNHEFHVECGKCKKYGSWLKGLK